MLSHFRNWKCKSCEWWDFAESSKWQLRALTRWWDVSPRNGRLWLPCGQAHEGNIAAFVHDDVTWNTKYLRWNWKETKRQLWGKAAEPEQPPRAQVAEQSRDTRIAITSRNTQSMHLCKTKLCKSCFSVTTAISIMPADAQPMDSKCCK